MIKLIILLIDFFFAFFNFTLAIRYYSHTSFMINVPCEVDGDLACLQIVRVINMRALHYTLGMRGFYLAIPLTLWLFGPLWMLFGVILNTAVLYKLDRTA